MGAALQCHGGENGILLVQLQKQLDKVCHNHTLSKRTSINTSQIRFAYDKTTHIQHECISQLQWHDIHISNEGCIGFDCWRLPRIIQLAQLRYAVWTVYGPNFVLELRISQVILRRTIEHLLNSFHNTDTGNRLERTYLNTLQIAVVAPSAHIYLWYS